MLTCEMFVSIKFARKRHVLHSSVTLKDYWSCAGQTKLSQKIHTAGVTPNSGWNLNNFFIAV